MQQWLWYGHERCLSEGTFLSITCQPTCTQCAGRCPELLNSIKCSHFDHRGPGSFGGGILDVQAKQAFSKPQEGCATKWGLWKQPGSAWTNKPSRRLINHMMCLCSLLTALNCLSSGENLPMISVLGRDSRTQRNTTHPKIQSGCCTAQRSNVLIRPRKWGENNKPSLRQYAPLQ